jgi:hypothetical protein
MILLLKSRHEIGKGKMKDQKIIALKNPNLIKLRDNIRRILLSACYFQIRQLSDQEVKIMNKTQWKSTVDSNRLKYQQEKIKKILEKSICTCNICNSFEKNMIFDKPSDEWYCLDCYSGYLKKIRHPLIQDLLKRELLS